MRGKVDTNQSEIVAALRACGCSVQSLAGVGKGVPDLLVWTPFRRGGDLLVFECKDGKKPPSKRERTPAQIIWHTQWKGPVYLVNSVDEAMEAAGIKP